MTKPALTMDFNAYTIDNSLCYLWATIGLRYIDSFNIAYSIQITLADFRHVFIHQMPFFKKVDEIWQKYDDTLKEKSITSWPHCKLATIWGMVLTYKKKNIIKTQLENHCVADILLHFNQFLALQWHHMKIAVPKQLTTLLFVKHLVETAHKYTLQALCERDPSMTDQWIPLTDGQYAKSVSMLLMPSGLPYLSISINSEFNLWWNLYGK